MLLFTPPFEGGMESAAVRLTGAENVLFSTNKAFFGCSFTSVAEWRPTKNAESIH
jgi:hypothetical protein